MTTKHLHFIGICGVAMSALAIAFKRAGYTVTGSDVGFYPPVSTNLKASGIDFYPGWHPDLVLRSFLDRRSLGEGGSEGGKDKKDLIVVVGNVASSSNPELLYAQENKLACVSYPELVRDFFIKKNSIVCAGTFGKSTSTTILAWILKEAGLDPSYLFGSIAENDLPPAALSKSVYSVVEGDEYKASRTDPGPKFAYYHPTHLLLTSVVWDHADIYPTELLYRAAFQKLVDALPPKGTLVVSEKAIPVLSFGDKKIITYGKGAGNTYAYSAVAQTRSGINFDIHFAKEIFHVSTTCLGEYMADNITGCFALARTIGVPPERIIAAIKSFRGVRRRLEKRFEGDITVFDDIAHSPQKAQAVLASLRAVYQKRIFAVFEPNTGNREPASAPGYAHAFQGADEIIIPHLTKIKIDPTKPAPMDGVALSSVIRATHSGVSYIDDDAKLLDYLKQKSRPGDVIVFLGSHGFRGMIETLVADLTG